MKEYGENGVVWKSGDGMIFQSIVFDIINRNGCFWKKPHQHPEPYASEHTEHNGHAFVDNVLTFFTPLHTLQCIQLFECLHFIKRKKNSSNKLSSIDRSEFANLTVSGKLFDWTSNILSIVDKIMIDLVITLIHPKKTRTTEACTYWMPATIEAFG